MKILVVDDDPAVLSLLKEFLTLRGRDVITAACAREAITLWTQQQPDLVLLDVLLPDISGWDLLSTIRASSRIPVIMLTGLDTPTDTARGLLKGADDYITKPFDLTVLEARISAVMRRYQATDQAALLHIGDLTIDNTRKEVRLQDRIVKLSPTEYELLKLLASHPGRVFSHEEIIQRIWSGKSIVAAGDVIRYVYLLREKLERDPKKPHLILTVRGFGYRLAD